MFDGCAAYNNADDGWDLYAKVWLAPLGPVTIKNCAAYRNGYLADGTPAGDGNGFKLGGDSMPGGHTLTNCVAYGNKRAGITSNSCPDLTIENCTAADNGRCNIELYSNYTARTDYSVSGLLSVYTSGYLKGLGDDEEPPASDNVSPIGDQDLSAIYGSNDFYYDAESGRSVSYTTDGSKTKETAPAPSKLFENTKFDQDKTFVRDKNGDLKISGGFLRTKTPGAGASF